jgi:hypothetical protein
MARDKDTPSLLTILRWASLIVVAASIAFIADYSALGNLPTIAEVAAGYGGAIVPPVFTKVICASTLFAFLLFYVEALWPRRVRITIYDHLVIPIALTTVLASCWVVAFRHQDSGLSTALVAAGTALCAVMFVRVASASPGRHSAWLRVPFSLYFAAASVGLFVSLTQWLNARELLVGTSFAEDDVTVAFLALAAVAGSFVAYRYSDFVYPAIIACSAGAIVIAQRAIQPHIASYALIVCAGMIAVSILAAVALSHPGQRNLLDLASRRRAKVARQAQDEGWHRLGDSSSMLGF